MSHSKPLASLILFGLLLTACTHSTATLTPYPTYDPFAPVNGNAGAPAQNNAVISPTHIAGGPTPTRAPISVNIPTGHSTGPLIAPTPDQPHLLPTPRAYAEQYTVQPGDTLGKIAQSYNIPLDTLMQANGMNEASILSVGTVIDIPPVSTDAAKGSAFKIIPDSELVYGPATIQFDLDAFLQKHTGYLSNYVQDVDGERLTGEQIIQQLAQSYSVNPRLLLAILEYRSGWVTNPTPQNVDYPFGDAESFRSGLYRQTLWAADNLNRGYYLWRANAISTTPLADGTYIPLDPTINAGTAGVQYFFSLFSDRATWDKDVSAQGLFQTYNQLFGYPFDFSIDSLIPPGLTQPPLRLPFEDGVTWSFTGGPHAAWNEGSAWSALDFAPPGEGGGCAISPDWVVAAADGYIVRADQGAVVEDLDNDGYEQTGWNILYMHISSQDRVPAGTYVYAGDRIGHPSCEGGVANATHLHLARKYNGEWIPADGNLPFNLDGWVSSGDGTEYDGFLTRGTVKLSAEEGVLPGTNQISR